MWPKVKFSCDTGQMSWTRLGLEKDSTVNEAVLVNTSLLILIKTLFSEAVLSQ